MAHSAAKRSSPNLVRPNMCETSHEDHLKSCGIQMEEKHMLPNQHLKIVLLGRTGAGKTSTGNTILGREAFALKTSLTSVTRDVAVEVGEVCGITMTVYDTPGFSATEKEEKFSKFEEVLQKCESGLSVFLLVIKADSFTKEEEETVEKMEKLLGEKDIQNTWILFTRGDKLQEENKTINELINETEALKKLVQKYDQRYHVFNNKKKASDQVISLISKVFQKEKRNLSNTQHIPINIQDTHVRSSSSRRIVLLGKAGFGKSAAGNTILGKKVFKSALSLFTVTSESSEKHATVSGRSVSVVDTPGFFDSELKQKHLMTDMARSVYLSSPGPHAFLIVFPLNMRITEQEQQIPQQIEMMFGEEVLKYSIILFTHGDQLKKEPVDYLIKENRALRCLIDWCGGRYHVFNNEDQNREQVNELLQKIDSMIEQNGGEHYSNQMFEDAQRYRREEEEQRKQKEVHVQIGIRIQKIGEELDAQKRSEIGRHKAKIQRKEEEEIHFILQPLRQILCLVEQ